MFNKAMMADKLISKIKVVTITKTIGNTHHTYLMPGSVLSTSVL